MRVKDRLEKLKQDNYMINHKALGDNAEMFDNDWIRIYKSYDGDCIDEMIYAVDVKDMEEIPESVLNMEYDYEGIWLIGGVLTLDMVVKLN
jgi:hypothetical protein